MARKEFCKRGHPRTPENLRNSNCRECERIKSKDRWEKYKLRNRDSRKAYIKEYQELNRDSINAFAREYQKEKWKDPAFRAKRAAYYAEYLKKQREEITDIFVRRTLNLEKGDAPQPLIEAKRLLIKLKKEIKNGINQNCQRSENDTCGGDHQNS